MGTVYLDQAGGGGVNTDDATATLEHVRAGKQVGIAGSDDIQTGTGTDVGAQIITVGKPTGSQLSYTITKGSTTVMVMLSRLLQTVSLQHTRLA